MLCGVYETHYLGAQRALLIQENCKHFLNAVKTGILYGGTVSKNTRMEGK